MSTKARAFDQLAIADAPMGVKLNTGGCAEGNLGLTGAGGLTRDWHGSWCGGFVRNLGIGERYHD